MKKIVVLDYGSGNLRSAERALVRAGAGARADVGGGADVTVTVTGDRDLAMECDGLVVPGVGAFAACMAGLRAIDGCDLIKRRVAAGRPVLGICVGMQVLFASGVEHGVKSDGCGIWPGVVERLNSGTLPLPHMGWNTVQAAPGSTLFAGLDPDTRFYFVHSYGVLKPAAGSVSWATHGAPFAAAVEDGVVSATQFHPEKSADAGATVLSNWLGSLR
jgi:imidazole glycerol-phosphate synthase subunit HisH